MRESNVSTAIDQTTARLEELVAERAGRRSASPLDELRRAAAVAFQEKGFPAPTVEEWRSTNLAPIARGTYVLANGRLDVSRYSLPSTISMVIENGVLGELPSLPSGVEIRTLTTEDELRRVGSLASNNEHPLASLNLALTPSVIEVKIGSSARLEQPLHFIYTTRGGETVSVSAPRVIITLERGTIASLIETFVGEASYFVTSVVEVFAGDGAVLDHTRIYRDSLEASHIANLQFHLERSSSVRSRGFTLGGALVRSEIGACLDGEGADCTIEGLYLLDGTQKGDHHSVIDHAKPHTTSLELFKGIVDGSAHGIFDGKIIVQKAAQKTSSKQTNNNLLLSSTAIADSKPQLEIYADDVKCAHGSTIGQLDEDSIFYLRARGIAEGEARALLTHAFASELIDSVKHEALRERLRSDLLEHVPATSEEVA